MGYIMEFLGSVLSYFPTEKYWIIEAMILNTMSTVVIVIAACDVGEWYLLGMKLLLAVVIGINRFSFGWVMPMVPRELSRRFPDMKELLVRSNSLWSLYVTIIVRVPLWYISK